MLACEVVEDGFFPAVGSGRKLKSGGRSGAIEMPVTSMTRVDWGEPP